MDLFSRKGARCAKIYLTANKFCAIDFSLVRLACFLPVAYVVAVSLKGGTEKVKEALVAFIINERTPPKVLFIFIGVCSVLGVFCAISLLLQPPR
jgi:hypothetical protein